MKCDKNCLECKLAVCKHDIEDRAEYIADVMRKKDRVRHAKYYQDNKTEIDEKQRERDKIRDRRAQSHEYYERHKEQLKAKHHERYVKDREERKRKAREHYQANKEKISERRKELYRQKKVKNL